MDSMKRKFGYMMDEFELVVKDKDDRIKKLKETIKDLEYSIEARNEEWEITQLQKEIEIRDFRVETLKERLEAQEFKMMKMSIELNNRADEIEELKRLVQMKFEKEEVQNEL